MHACSPAIVWILIIFMIIPAHANSFDDLNTAYVSSVSQLPSIDDSRLKPDRVEQSSGHIRAWMDIVGFQEVVRVNGSMIDYINGSPADKAVVRYKSWAVITVPTCGYSIKNTLSTTNSGSNALATLGIKLTWQSKHCGKNGCTCVEHIESASFQDYEASPVQYPNSSIPQLTLHQFPNSSKVLLEVNIDEKITSFSVTTDNGSVTRYIQTGQVVYTAKGVPYANFTRNLPIWNSTGKGIYHQGNDIALDSSNFSFSAKTPFDTRNEMKTNITIIKEQPTSMSMLNVLIFIMLGMGYVACKLAWKVARI